MVYKKIFFRTTILSMYLLLCCALCNRLFYVYSITRYCLCVNLKKLTINQFIFYDIFTIYRENISSLSILRNHYHLVDAFNTTSYGRSVLSFTAAPSIRSKTVLQDTIPNSLASKPRAVMAGTLFSSIVLL